MENPFNETFNKVFADRKEEADEFYKNLLPDNASKDLVALQRLAGVVYGLEVNDMVCVLNRRGVEVMGFVNDVEQHESDLGGQV